MMEWFGEGRRSPYNSVTGHGAMIDKIVSKFDFSNPKDGMEVWLFLLAVWLMVVASVIWSIISHQ